MAGVFQDQFTELAVTPGWAKRASLRDIQRDVLSGWSSVSQDKSLNSRSAGSYLIQSLLHPQGQNKIKIY